MMGTKTLRIELIEIMGREKIDMEIVKSSRINNTIVETETDLFFLLDVKNYKDFISYFDFTLDDLEKESICQYFGSCS